MRAHTVAPPPVYLSLLSCIHSDLADPSPNSWLPLLLCILCTLWRAHAGDILSTHTTAMSGMTINVTKLIGDPCYDHPDTNDCLNCTRKGCFWCHKAQGYPFCTSKSDPMEAQCAMPGCSADTFYLSRAQCSGGCASLSHCEDCVKVEGCGYCHDSKNGASCMEVNITDSKPQACDVWAGRDYTQCSLPCDMRHTCESCMLETRACTWCGDTCKLRTNSAKVNGRDALNEQEDVCVLECPQTDMQIQSSTLDQASYMDKSSEQEHGAYENILIGVIVVVAVMGAVLYYKL